MQTRKEFSKNTKNLLNRNCQICGVSTKPLEDHHLIQVNWVHIKSSNTCFNCLRVCKSCHDKIVHTLFNDLLLTTKSLKYFNLLSMINITIDDSWWKEILQLYLKLFNDTLQVL